MKTAINAPTTSPDKKPSGINYDITFADHGQDFLRWKIRNGIVVECEPFQGSLWCQRRVINKRLRVGDFIKVTSGLSDIIPGAGHMTIRYPLETVTRVKPEDSIYGYEVTFTRRKIGGGVGERQEPEKFHMKGSEKAVRRAARLKRRFAEIINVDPFTEDQYKASFGEGRM